MDTLLSLETLIDFENFLQQKSTNNIVDYLKRGRLLEDLAREKYQRTFSGITFNEVEKRLYSMELKSTDSVITCLKKVIRPFLRKCTCEEDFEPLLKLCGKYRPDITFPETYPRYRSLVKHIYTKEDVCLKVVAPGGPECYGAKNQAHAQSYNNILLRTGETVADIATLFAILICCNSLSNVLEDMDKREKINLPSLSPKVEFFRNYKGNPVDDIPNDYKEHSEVIVPRQAIPLFNKEEVKEFFEANFRHITFSDLRYEEEVVKGYHGEYPAIIFSSTMWYRLHRIKDLEVWENAKNVYGRCLEEHRSGHVWAIPNNFSYIDTLEEAFIVEFNARRLLFSMYQEFEKLKTSYARSFQTKKNIPQKTLKAMENSNFNKYFGYVEFDEDVDLTKISELEKEFSAFFDKYLPFVDAMENSLRFRKLGNHKASGLYYPHVKCLCVDIHSPSSFTHELGHLIDYTYGSLSLKSNFSQILTIYKSRLLKQMENEEFKRRMNSSGKYNLSYYLKPTEVFARCFEIYFVKILEVENSLTPSVIGHEYPIDDEFLGYIRNYFSNMFSHMEKSTEMIAATKAAQPERR